jgi:hypothetical protein
VFRRGNIASGAAFMGTSAAASSLLRSIRGWRLTCWLDSKEKARGMAGLKLKEIV